MTGAKKKEDNLKLVFLQAAISGLKEQPAYLLIFLVSALFLLFGLTTGVAAAVEKN